MARSVIRISREAHTTVHELSWVVGRRGLLGSAVIRELAFRGGDPVTTRVQWDGYRNRACPGCVRVLPPGTRCAVAIDLVCRRRCRGDSPGGIAAGGGPGPGVLRALGRSDQRESLRLTPPPSSLPLRPAASTRVPLTLRTTRTRFPRRILRTGMRSCASSAMHVHSTSARGFRFWSAVSRTFTVLART